MKTSLLILLLTLCTGVFLYAQSAQPDTSVKPQAPVAVTVTVPAPNPQPVKYSFADTSYEHGLFIIDNGRSIYYPRKLDIWQYVLVFLPVLLFGFILYYVLAKLVRENYKLSEMLSDESTVEVENPLLTAWLKEGKPLADFPKDIPTRVKETVWPRSTSRLAAFLSSLMAVTVGACATSYYFYVLIKTGQAPNLSSLFDILLGLGVGVVPYAVNKLSSAVSGSK